MTESALLERMITAADPARTPRDAQPDAEALEMLERIVHGELTPRHDPRVGARWAAAAAAVVVACTTVFALTVPQGEAVAVTPAPLQFREAGSVHEIVNDAQQTLEAGGGPSQPERFVRAASWGISVDMDRRESEIVPQVSTLTWEPDLSGHMTIIAGEAYDPADAKSHTSAEVRSTDEVITDLTIAPGEFDTPIPDPPADTEEGVRAMMSALGTPADPSAGEVVLGFTSALEQWTLTNTQEAHVLDMLASAGGVTALGESTDRLGRPVTGLSLSSANGAANQVVLISRDTGRIVGLETTNLVDDGVFPVGAIVSYRLYDVTEEMVE